jgi:hypothetical protein
MTDIIDFVIIGGIGLIIGGILVIIGRLAKIEQSLENKGKKK